jgi:hypothetical protein
MQEYIIAASAIANLKPRVWKRALRIKKAKQQKLRIAKAFAASAN